MTKLIVGLGNPGKSYEQTRHNAGFMVLDALLKLSRASFGKEKKLYKITNEPVLEQTAFLAQPKTFMNESGAAVRQMLTDLNLPPEHCLVVVDDVNIELGTVRLRQSGSAGGHNGLQSVIVSIGAHNFPRIRVGVGLPPNGQKDLTDHVLGRFREDEYKVLEPAILEARDLCVQWAKS